MKDINKKVLNDLQFVSREEQKELMSMLNIMGREPQTKLIMAIFRDIVMYKEMSNAYLMKYRMKMSEMESRIKELEENKKCSECGH